MKEFFMENYICGTKFQNLADVKLHRNGQHDGDINNCKTVYCHTHDFKYVYKKIEKIKNDVVLITHNSDGAIKNSKEGDRIGENDADYALKPDNVKYWFGQNIECDEQKNLIQLPIGLENRYCFDYDKAEMLYNELENSEDYIPKNRIYVNFNLRTNPLERNTALNTAYNLLKNKGENFVHIRMGSNGERYNEYLSDITESTYVLSPRGNGLDCHRTWETLYLGRIPIVKNLQSLLSSLPHINVDSWDELLKINYHHRLFNPFDYRKLWMPYWRFYIEHSANRNNS